MNHQPPASLTEVESPELDESEVDAGNAAATGEFPQIDFTTFVLSLSHSVLVHLGDTPNPVDGTSDQNMPMARQTIDLLSLLEQKTRGNLTGEEERVLQQALYDLRLRYVEVSRRK